MGYSHISRQVGSYYALKMKNDRGGMKLVCVGLQEGDGANAMFAPVDVAPLARVCQKHMVFRRNVRPIH